MSLKDLKSNLGDYRKPKSEPLEVKTRVEPSAFNTVPLTDKVKTKNDVRFSKQTPEKIGTNQNKVVQGDKFKGQTDPNEVTQGDKFKGQTEPTEVTQGDKFKGETSPKPMSLEERFLGQTEPNEVTQGDKFKGETEPNQATQGDKFKGETEPNEVTQGDKFKGETEPGDFKFSQKFLGETTPNEFKFTQQFLGETTQKESDRSSKFLGETTPTESDRSSKFLGETTPNQMNLSEQFLGETDKQNITQGDRFKGETTPGDFTFSGNLESQGLEVPQKVDFFTNDKAEGFSPFMKTKDDTKFTGISDTQFDNASSLLSNFGGSSRGISFQAGYGQYKVGAAIGDTQRYSPDGDRYIDSFTSIGDLLQQRQSPSFLDEMYNKFNLQDPAANKFSLVPQPYVLRGIQRNSFTEPQNWGLGVPIDDGLIRGGVVASTERAVLDLVRLGSFFLSVKGLLWSATQIGLQRTNKYNKTWTPANFLGAIGGQHIGFKPDRSGILGLDVDGKYQKVGLGKIASLTSDDTLEKLYGDFSKIEIGSALREDKRGGIDSLYGIGVSQVKKYVSTFVPGKTTGEFEQKGTGLKFKQKFVLKDSFDLKTKQDQTYTQGDNAVPKKKEELKKFGVAKQVEKKDDSFPLDDKFVTSNPDGLVKGIPDISDYQMISYGKLSEIADDRKQKGANPPLPTDFRKKLDGGRGKENAQDYDKNNIEKDFGFGNPGRMLDAQGNVRKGQFDVDFTKLADFTLHVDKINALKIGETSDDLVPLVFKLGEDGSRLQFRGTVSGLSENFSPSYTEIKYSGRAEPVYVYDSFKRDISFNFKVYPTSRVEMQPLYTKLERLSTYTMPKYVGSNGYTAPGKGGAESELQLTIGKLYVDTPMILTSLSYAYSDETTWDIDFGLPMGIDISVGCTILGNELHQYESEKVFSFDGSFRV